MRVWHRDFFICDIIGWSFETNIHDARAQARLIMTKVVGDATPDTMTALMETVETLIGVSNNLLQ